MDNPQLVVDVLFLAVCDLYRTYGHEGRIHILLEKLHDEMVKERPDAETLDEALAQLTVTKPEDTPTTKR